jgi:hypothetical protein
MPEQAALFHDSIYDAVGAVVSALGGKKKMATQLWPHLKPETAYTRLAHCLSDEFPEKLSPEELLFLARAGREAGCHSIMAYLAGECGYAPPEPVDPVSEADALRREIRDGLAALNRMYERLERTEVRAGLRVAG